jgi:hypothetical protein
MKWGWDFSREVQDKEQYDGPYLPRLRSSRGANNISIAKSSGASETVEMDTPIRFKVQKANGGTIIEVQHYDRKRDEHNYNLHIIGEDEDISVQLGKIVVIEMMKS